MAITLIASTAIGVPHGGYSLPINTTGASCILVSVSSYATGPAPTVTDTKGNTYTGLTVRTVGLTRQQLFYTIGGTFGTAHQVNVVGAGIYAGQCILAFAGIGLYDGQQNGATGTTSPLAAGSVTPTGPGALVVTALGSDQPATDSVPAGFTAGPSVGYGSLSHFQGTTAYLVQATAAAVNPVWAWTGSHPSAAAVVAVFTPAVTPVAVPNVVGLTQAAADAALVAVGLITGTVTTATSPTVPAGSVISQSPTAGTLVAPGSAVALVVSSGLPPDYTWQITGLTGATRWMTGLVVFAEGEAVALPPPPPGQPTASPTQVVIPMHVTTRVVFPASIDTWGGECLCDE